MDLGGIRGEDPELLQWAVAPLLLPWGRHYEDYTAQAAWLPLFPSKTLSLSWWASASGCQPGPWLCAVRRSVPGSAQWVPAAPALHVVTPALSLRCQTSSGKNPPWLRSVMMSWLTLCSRGGAVSTDCITRRPEQRVPRCAAVRCAWAEESWVPEPALTRAHCGHRNVPCVLESFIRWELSVACLWWILCVFSNG